MDSCLVLTECFSCQILRFRTLAIGLIRSERVSTSTSVFAHRLAYSSHAYMIMPKFWCHEYETGSLYFGPLLKISLSFTLRTILRSPVTIWPHGAYRNGELEQLLDGRYSSIANYHFTIVINKHSVLIRHVHFFIFCQQKHLSNVTHKHTSSGDMGFLPHLANSNWFDYLESRPEQAKILQFNPSKCYVGI